MKCKITYYITHRNMFRQIVSGHPPYGNYEYEDVETIVCEAYIVGFEGNEAYCLTRNEGIIKISLEDIEIDYDEFIKSSKAIAEIHDKVYEERNAELNAYKVLNNL